MSDSRVSRLSVRERIEPKLDKSSGCWIFTGHVDKLPRNYGQLSVNNRKVKAHSAYYEAVKGKVPAGLELDHLCEVKPCCNPDHLEPVTHAENMRRAWVKRKKPVCTLGHDSDANNIHVAVKGGRRTCRVCEKVRNRRRYYAKKTKPTEGEREEPEI